jgi:hypothetical protein
MLHSASGITNFTKKEFDRDNAYWLKRKLRAKKKGRRMLLFLCDAKNLKIVLSANTNLLRRQQLTIAGLICFPNK